MIKSMSRNLGGRMRSKTPARRSSGGNNSSNQYQESNGPGSVKIKGSVNQILDRYTNLAKDAQQSGSDRVQVENLLQHAEHYLRVVKQRKEREKANGVQVAKQQPQSNGNHVASGNRRRNRFDGDSGRTHEKEAPHQNGSAGEDEDKQGLLDVLGFDRDDG